MARKSPNPSFDQATETLRANGFVVTPYAGFAGAVLAAKYGAGAVLAPVQGAAVAFKERPGALYGAEVALLLDRGYQKFLKTKMYEFPATAAHLQAIHLFSEEMSLLLGTISLYNESLGTTSDVYDYDRLKGRGVAEHAPVQPWSSADGH